MDRCLFCQGEVDGATHLCRRCGRVQPAQFATTLLDSPTLPLTVRCPDCGNLLPAQAQFCGTCGRKLALPTEQPPRDNGMKQPSPPLAGHLAATQQAPPTSPAAATVFLSYSHQDHDFMLRLQTDLRAQGIHIWVDYEVSQARHPRLGRSVAQCHSQGTCRRAGRLSKLSPVSRCQR